MPRANQLLHPARTPAALRSAATVLLLRDGAQGLEVLMTRRSSTASFAPGAYVFPGGGIDPADALCHAQATRRATQSDLHLTQAIAAIRESFEELGVLLARQADGSHVTSADIAALDRKAPFAEQCAARGLTLDAAEVFVLAHWITDRDLPRRFDVPFLVARMPEGQEPVADESEQFEPVWVKPADALARHAAGGFFIIFPTIRTLERLQAHDTVQSVLDACAVNDEPLFTSCPRAGLLGGAESRHMEHEAPFGELALVCPDGQITHALDWQTERPVPLLKNVHAPDRAQPRLHDRPGHQQLPGGRPGHRPHRHRPRPGHPGTPGAAVACRRWRHPRHRLHPFPPGPLARCRPPADAVQRRRQAPPPILGLPSAPTSRENSRFTPERALADGERLTLQNAKGETVTTLRVVHTPGHAANHLCLVLEEDGLLFSGDHILNGSTTVIDPPDGNMGAYLDSLDLLDQVCEQHGVDFILPAHGYVLGDLKRTADNPSAPEDGGARAAIAHLKAHRLAREAKVARAMQAQPQGTMDDWVRTAYDDVPERLWPVAKRSLLAHVERIQSLGGFNL